MEVAEVEVATEVIVELMALEPWRKQELILKDFFKNLKKAWVEDSAWSH